MAENKEIKKSHNFLQVAGVLLETNIEIEREVERELTNSSQLRVRNKKIMQQKSYNRNPILQKESRRETTRSTETT